MKTTILLAGVTGTLGGLIVEALVKNGANVRAIVRTGSDKSRLEKLLDQGVQIVEATYNDHQSLVSACREIECVVSALAGLREVVVDAQRLLLNAAVEAKVERFIPSDFSTDFTKLPEAENRNFDLRKEFKQLLDQADIKPTSIFNGAFAEMLTYNIPFLDHKNKTVAYWEKADWKVDFTSMKNTAAFTAAAAQDQTSPRYLRIASFQISAREMAIATGYTLKDMGTLESLDAFNIRERAAHPEGENELYAKWQQSQYMHSMFSARNELLDNNRYPGINWSAVDDYIKPVKYEKA